MSNSKNNKPVYRKILRGGISAAVFENTRDERTYRSINLQRSYKQNGKWNRMSIYLDHEHIPFMIEALNATWNSLNEYPVNAINDPDELDSGDADPTDTPVAEEA